MSRYRSNQLITKDDEKTQITHLEASRAPVHKMNVLAFDLIEGIVDFLGCHVSSIQETARHVLVVGHVTFYQLISRMETLGCHLCHPCEKPSFKKITFVLITCDVTI